MDTRSFILTALRASYRRRWFILIVTVLALAAALVREVSVRPNVEAEVVLAAASFRAGEEGLGALVPEMYNARIYQELVVSATVMGEARDDLISAGFWSENREPPSPLVFCGQLSSEVRVLDQTTRPVSFSPFIVLRVSDHSEERARQIADAWARAVIRAANRVDQLRISRAAQVLADRAEEYKGVLDQLWEQQAIEQSEWNVDVLKAQLDQCVHHAESLHVKAVEFEQLRVAAQERLTAAEEGLAAGTRFLELNRAPSDDVYWEQRAEGATEAELVDLAGRSMKTEVLNQTYLSLERDASLARQDLAAHAAAQKRIEEELAGLDSRRQTLQQQWAEHTFKQRNLQVKADVYEQAYTEINRTHLSLAALSDMVNEDTPESGRAIGLNRVSPNAYVRERVGIAGAKGRVLAAAFLAFLLSVGLAALESWRPALMHLMKEDGTIPLSRA